MATLQDVLTIPDGWSLVDSVQPVDIRTIDPTTTVEIDTAELWAVDIAGIEFGTPNVAAGLQQAAQQHGSNVYGVALLRHDVPEQCGSFPTLGGLVTCTRYRYVIVHSQFQALAILVGLVVAIGFVVVWVCNNNPASQPCGDQVQSFAHDTLSQMCQMFGAGCALQALGVVIIGASLLSIGFAGLLFFVESGIAREMGLHAPGLPAVRAPQPPQLRVSARTPGLIPGVTPGVSVGAGGRGGRRGGGSR